MTASACPPPSERGAREPGRTRAWVAALAVLTLAAVGVLAPIAEAAFPGQNGQIAFTRPTVDTRVLFQDDLWTMNPDGTLQVNRTPDNLKPDQEPAFSADGSKIAFQSARGASFGPSEIYTMDALTGALTRLTTTGGLEPAFSRNGRRIAFVSQRDAGNREIYAMDSADVGGDGNGDNQVRLTMSADAESAPVFSPDGSKIAFNRQAAFGAPVDLWTMNPDGTGAAKLASNAIGPDFSPDGSKIAFARGGEIYTMKADGSLPVTKLTDNAAEDSQPAFSPDGLKIAFTSFRDGDNEIYTMNANGSDQVNRSLFPRVSDSSPSWGITPASADKAPPETTITSGPTGTTNDDTPTFEFSSSESGSSFECRVDSAAFASCSSPHTTAQLGGGPHTFEVRATDPAGNTDASPASRAFTVDTAGSSDTTPPQTTITSGPTGTTNDNTPTFEFSSSETGSTFECRVDAAAFASCTSPHTTATLADGEHTFEVRATDAARNADPTPAIRTFTVDTAPPQTTIDSGPTGTTGDSTPTFEFSSDEANSTFECKLDTGSFAACTSPHTTATLADGEHTLQVRATDPAGNPDQSPASRTFTVNTAAPPDTTAPQTTIASGPTGTTNDNTPTFEFSSSETGSSFECKLDTGSFAACTSPHTTATLADGEHTFQVRATDPAGNLDQSPASRTFTVNTAAPRPSPSPPSAPSLLPPPPGQARAPDTTRPLIGALSLSRTRFRAAGSGPSIATAIGTRVSYALSEPASVSFRVERALSGRRVGGRCVRTRRTNRRARRCTRYRVLRGGFARSGKAGQNAFKFRGRLNGRKLAPRRYRLRAIATDKAGNKSLLKRTGFRIVRR